MAPARRADELSLASMGSSSGYDLHTPKMPKTLEFELDFQHPYKRPSQGIFDVVALSLVCQPTCRLFSKGLMPFFR